jgi:large subunit ribosomal protein L37Ae
MGRTKKIGTAGRFGSRYGKKDRQKVADIEKIQRQRHVCPRCGLPYVQRQASGIWKCRKCGNKFTGLSYYPRSESFKRE